MEQTEKIQTLIVDDEHYAREELKHLLGEFSSIKIVGVAETGEGAVMQALKLQPDVVFLDIEMPKMNGMEAAQSLRELKKVPLIVFSTAYPEFAAEAFRYEALDYLLKPYDEDQLQQTVERIEKQLFTPDARERSLPSSGKLAVEREGEIVYIKPANILYIYRKEKVSKIITTNGEFESKTPLKELENRLAPFSFFRIHKSYVVNLDHITRLTPWFNGAYQLEVTGGEEKLSVSRNYVKTLRERLEL
ncbi:LytR/AlgR family response regulator transcription factor [Salinibacillus xinjiangensis]|uniref:Response regulator n=1 Tax=Salinibacillus xinjiangensis TaxID=1229268 RepID=A0A6G1X7R4_9BACI|nr:LytTR family DNA-binding domain-containing protein [Salinibacillus xinjiangensis]MRG86945.1 response regulator [Salinibacillus xinjiangensis]